MSNQLYHNKWHGFNHFTVPLSTYPDSATDPIASDVYPFRGIFYNKITGTEYGLRVVSVTIVNPGSGYINTPTLTLTGNRSQGFSTVIPPTFKVTVDTVTKTITGIEVLESGRFYPAGLLQLRPASGDNIFRNAILSLSSEFFELNSDSLNWGYYSSVGKANSGFFQLYPPLSTTIFYQNSSWSLGFEGYTNKVANSAKWETVFNFVSTVSASEKYVGLSLIYPASSRTPDNINRSPSEFNGIGWQVSLSSTNHHLNRRKQVDIKQKASRPVSLYENADKTVSWNTTAQVVYYTLTGNYTLTASQIFNAKKGGKYTMWLAIDFCPESNMRFVFDKRFYNISLKKWDNVKGDNFSTSTNVLQLCATSITRIDFVFDGVKMLGRATHYRTFIETTDDLYFAGIGLRFVDPLQRLRSRNPVYVNNAVEAGNHFDLKRGEFNVVGDMTNINPIPGLPPEYVDPFSDLNDTGIFFDSPYINYPNRQSTPVDLRSDFDSNSSLYVPGSGISFRYLGSGLQYFNFTTSNAQFPSEIMLSKFISLTSSFDRVIAYLSAGSWLVPQNAVNLVASPDETQLTPTISAAFPQPPYKFNSSNFVSVNQCLSTFTIEVFSGKDRDIASISLNGSRIPITPVVLNGMTMPYNFNNERTATLTLFRIQQDYNVEVSFTNQPITTIPNLLLSFGSLNGFTIKQTLNKITTWSNNFDKFNYSFVQNNTNLSPTLTTFKASRFVSFGTPLGNNTEMTLDSNLQRLSSIDSKFLKSFCTFTVFRVRSFVNNSFIWWLGDFTGTTEQKGYGLVLSASSANPNRGRIFTMSNYQRFGDVRGVENDPLNLNANEIYVVATNYDSSRRLSQTVLINSVPSLTQRSMFFARFNNDMTNYNLVMGKHPTTGTGYSNVDIFDFVMFDRALQNNELLLVNNYFNNKYKGSNSYKIL